MAKKGIWISYDLGVGGDYQNLYGWLDDMKAIECGNNVSYIKYEWDIHDDEGSVRRLLHDIEGRVTLKPGNRLYLIRPKIKDPDSKEKTVGSFIYGKRMANPWEGYGSRSTDETEEA